MIAFVSPFNLESNFQTYSIKYYIVAFARTYKQTYGGDYYDITYGYNIKRCQGRGNSSN